MKNRNSQLVMTYTGPFYESFQNNFNIIIQNMLQIIISAKYVVKKKSFCNRALDKGKFSLNVFFIFICDKLFFWLSTIQSQGTQSHLKKENPKRNMLQGPTEKPQSSSIIG